MKQEIEKIKNNDSNSDVATPEIVKMMSLS